MTASLQNWPSAAVIFIGVIVGRSPLYIQLAEWLTWRSGHVDVLSRVVGSLVGVGAEHNIG